MVQNELYNFRHLNNPTDQLFNINCIFAYDTYDFVICIFFTSKFYVLQDISKKVFLFTVSFFQAKK